jgi:hypothetical protein
VQSFAATIVLAAVRVNCKRVQRGILPPIPTGTAL